jgi:hypothetical protein
VTKRKTCFVIAPIGDPGSEVRKRSDQILNYVIEPAVRPLGFDPIRADQISETGIITSQVIQHVVEDPLVVADLTDRNPNVYYELAIRHALRLPLVQIIRAGESLPFDVAGMRTVFVDHHDLDSVESAKAEIGKLVESTQRDSDKIETPISVSLDLHALRQSGDPGERSLADVLEAITALSGTVRAIDGFVRRPERLIPPAYLGRVFRYQDRQYVPHRLLVQASGAIENLINSETEIVAESQFRELKELLRALAPFIGDLIQWNLDLSSSRHGSVEE